MGPRVGSGVGTVVGLNVCALDGDGAGSFVGVGLVHQYVELGDLDDDELSQLLG